MPTPSYRQFDADLQEFARRLDADIGLVTRRVALQVFTGIVEKTPVDTGRARSNWAINVGAPAPTPSTAISEEEADSLRRTGERQSSNSVTSRTIKEAEAEAAGIDGTVVVHITNNLPYISRLNEGHSRQAPAGFVETTLDEVANQIIET